ncbi:MULTISPECIES: helix-turn-helix domain-containing protein [unclassified Paenibacillus]|uniref:helix-turn-helix domain-containing protein n=1 Tax=unclassified Paenibacillus TaxID=185978 RepID=UPI0003F5EFEF|nr:MULTISPECIES: helix-turn-helix domain-containing protein [unclassified Paenibacillus]KGP82123.1 hypothetical protein P364_0113795 [Paenibacillus sp. MAEPY2]KGP84772.1 hypothetical protein P363_0123035 [Paenibacillus sp. MAEPY1]
MERIFGSVKIKSAWFDHTNEKRKFLKIGYEGLYVYLALTKNRLHRVNENRLFTFQVSIDTLRKETGYSAKKVIELLKVLKSNKIIKMEKPSRWDRLNDEDGIANVYQMMIISAIDVPHTDWDKVKKKDIPVDGENFFVSVNLDMLELYKKKGLKERYIPLYCLFRKLSNGTEGKAFMRIEKMAKTLGFSKDTIHKYIKRLNAEYLLYTRKIPNGKGGYKFEHYLCSSVGDYDEFLRAHKDSIDKNISRWKMNDYLLEDESDETEVGGYSEGEKEIEDDNPFIQENDEQMLVVH